MQQTAAAIAAHCDITRFSAAAAAELVRSVKEATMSQDLISVIDVAHQHGKRKSVIFKVLKRLQIVPKKRPDSSSGPGGTP